MKSKCIYSLFIITFIFFFTSGCIKSKTSDNLQAVVKGNSAFGFDLYHELKGNEGNLFFSPYSISIALAINYAGARGQTAEEMAKVLHFSLKQESLHSAFSMLQSHLNAIQNKGRLKLNIANSLWGQKGYHFLKKFVDLSKGRYGASLNLVDFINQPKVARRTINTWGEKETQGKIKKLIKEGELSALTKLVLCNAIYFKGTWLKEFPSIETRTDRFYIAPDLTRKVPMMNQKAKFKFKNFGDFRAIELPYEGNDISMIVFLPKRIDGLKKLEGKLSNESIKEWIGQLIKSNKSETALYLPKFTTTCEFELSDVLTKMGMFDAFSASADFSGMASNKNVYINKVIHKSFVDVNEEGTEAAAVTAVVTRTKAMSPYQTFYVNHPFIFIIRENKTGSILFIGRIVDPTK